MSDQLTPTSQSADPVAGLDPAALLQRGISTTPPAKRPQPPTPGELETQLPELAVHELIGQGGMGAVYRATQRNLDRPVALKVMSRELGADPAFAARFVREAKAMARLSHPGIVAVHDFGQRGDLCWLVMELVEGANLREVMRTGRLSPAQALAIVPQLCDALQNAHDEGVIHRDIKPENILLDQRGRVKITDFGLAKVPESDRPLGEALTASGDRLGTVHYMAPEQVEGAKSVDHRVDIYSLGVVFYEMLTGGLPLGRFEPPSRRIAIDVQIDEVVLKALEKDPQRRWQQASEVQRAVEYGGAPAAKEAGVQKSSASRGNLILEIPRWRPVATAIVVVAALVLLLPWITTDQHRGPTVAAPPSPMATPSPPLIPSMEVESVNLERERQSILRMAKIGDITAARVGIVGMVNRDPQATVRELVRDVDVIEASGKLAMTSMKTGEVEGICRELLSKHPQDAVVAHFVIPLLMEYTYPGDLVIKAAQYLDQVTNDHELRAVWTWARPWELNSSGDETRIVNLLGSYPGIQAQARARLSFIGSGNYDDMGSEVFADHGRIPIAILDHLGVATVEDRIMAYFLDVTERGRAYSEKYATWGGYQVSVKKLVALLDGTPPQVFKEALAANGIDVPGRLWTADHDVREIEARLVPLYATEIRTCLPAWAEDRRLSDDGPLDRWSRAHLRERLERISALLSTH